MTPRFEDLVSPLSGDCLTLGDGALRGLTSGEVFPITNGVASLLDEDHLGSIQRSEQEVFDNLTIQGASFFREGIYCYVFNQLARFIPSSGAAVELGGGEGHWARRVQDQWPGMRVYVCDLSISTLERAPERLRRVAADMTRPIFAPESLSLAAFWVSLHHLPRSSWSPTLKHLVAALKPGGMVMAFEPNQAFWPRRLAYNTALAKDLYPDEREQAVDFGAFTTEAERQGLTVKKLWFCNPPYSPSFVRQLKRWPIYQTATEILHQADRWLVDPICRLMSPSRGLSVKRALTLYGLAILRKEQTGDAAGPGTAE